MIDNTNTQPEENVDVVANTDVTEGNEQSEKTFTQSELDKIINDRLKRERAKMPSKDDLKKYNDWQESQKTEEQKWTEKQNEYEQQINSLKEENSKYMLDGKLRGLGVQDKYVGLVSKEFLSYSGEDIEKDINEYLQKYPEFTNQQQHASYKTGAKVDNNSNTNASHSEFLARIGLKPEDIK